MKPSAILVMVILVPIGLLANPVSDLLPPQKRAETLILARDLLTSKAFDSSVETLAAMNPFDPIQPSAPNAEPEKGASQSVAPVLVSDRELLKRMAEGVVASGMMQLGDRTFLLVGKKKLKVGDRLAVNSDGNAYELEISAIDRTSFTLRLKDEEITRPIKSPVKKP
jgi:hypothetical protein